MDASGDLLLGYSRALPFVHEVLPDSRTFSVSLFSSHQHGRTFYGHCGQGQHGPANMKSQVSQLQQQKEEIIENGGYISK